MLTRKQKTSFKISFYVGLVGFLFGCWVWLSLFRLVNVKTEIKSTYSLIILKTPEVGDQVVFTYPNLNSPLRLSTLERGNLKGEFKVKIGEEWEILNEDLIVGVLVF